MVVDQGGPNSQNFVSANRRSDTASTNRNSALYFAGGHCFGERDNEIGVIVARVEIASAEVENNPSSAAATMAPHDLFCKNMSSFPAFFGDRNQPRPIYSGELTANKSRKQRPNSDQSYRKNLWQNMTCLSMMQRVTCIQLKLQDSSQS